MAQTVAEQKRPRGDKSKRSEALIQRSLRAYELSLAGLSVRGIGEELGLKSTQTVWADINRGKQYAIDRGIDVEERRIDIDRMFKETLGHLAQTIRHQSEHGCETFFVNEDGSKSMKRIKGIDPRIAGELSRSLHRWSEFLGLMDRVPEQNVTSQTLIQLSAPGDGANFADRWGSSDHGSDHVDVTATAATLPTTEVSSQ
jgi:hypothetical protein